MNMEQDLEQLESMDKSFLEVSEAKRENTHFQYGVCTRFYKSKSALRRHLQLHSYDFIYRRCSKKKFWNLLMLCVWKLIPE